MNLKDQLFQFGEIEMKDPRRDWIDLAHNFSKPKWPPNQENSNISSIFDYIGIQKMTGPEGKIFHMELVTADKMLHEQWIEFQKQMPA